MGFQTTLGPFKSAIGRKDFRYFSNTLQWQKDENIIGSDLEIHAASTFQI